MKKTKKSKYKDFINELSTMLPSENAMKARKDAEKEIFKIRLSELRKKMGLKQDDIKSFSQSSISKLESRKDIKISTLIEYIHDIGMGLEIKAYTKKTKDTEKEQVILLRT